VGHAFRGNYLEGYKLKLSTENFPISCSLRPQFEEAIEKAARGNNEHVMSLEELLAYLKTPHDLDQPPYVDILHQTEEMGDPSLPGPEHSVTLRWIGEALLNYEKRFPVEEPLASSIRRLKPLVAAVALVDPDFMQPDVHPLHQLLDAIQERAVGWQSTLGRAGANLQKQVDTAVEGALGWFENQSMDLSPICAEFLDAAERDRSRAVRMSQRVVDKELGRIRTVAVKKEAATMINSTMAEYDVPQEICEFLQGPWFESAQLVLHKFSAESRQWEKMTSTTNTLLDSIQSLEDANEERRQHIYSVATKLPKEMRRWLLSLHHDTAAVNDAMQKVEFTQLRVLKNQQVDCVKADPISVNDDLGAQAGESLAAALNVLEEGQWLEIETLTEGTIRAQIALKNEQEQRLIFTNMAGIKAAEYSFLKFDELMSLKRVTALPSGSGFSLCLASAAGIKTSEQLDELYALVTAKLPSPKDEGESAEETPPEPDSADEPEDLASYLVQAMERNISANAEDDGPIDPDSPAALYEVTDEAANEVMHELDTEAPAPDSDEITDEALDEALDKVPEEVSAEAHSEASEVIPDDVSDMVNDELDMEQMAVARGAQENPVETNTEEEPATGEAIKADIAPPDENTATEEGSEFSETIPPSNEELAPDSDETGGGVEAGHDVATEDVAADDNQTLAEAASRLRENEEEAGPSQAAEEVAESSEADAGHIPAAPEENFEEQRSPKPLDLSDSQQLEDLFTEDFLSDDEMRGLESLIAEDEMSEGSGRSSYFAPEVDTESAFLLEEEESGNAIRDDNGELDLSAASPPPSHTVKPDSPGYIDYLEDPEAPTTDPGTSGLQTDIVPMNTWLGFHDTEVPLMAKLAVHDPASDNYIFVNRAGKKLREVSGNTLATLLVEGLVDILNIE
jgi:Protein of unknown function (DUF1631)